MGPILLLHGLLRYPRSPRPQAYKVFVLSDLDFLVGQIYEYEACVRCVFCLASFLLAVAQEVKSPGVIKFIDLEDYWLCFCIFIDWFLVGDSGCHGKVSSACHMWFSGLQSDTQEWSLGTTQIQYWLRYRR